MCASHTTPGNVRLHQQHILNHVSHWRSALHDTSTRSSSSSSGGQQRGKSTSCRFVSGNMAVLPQGLRLQCPSLQEAAYLYDEIIRDDVYFQCGIKVCVTDAGAPLVGGCNVHL